MEPRAMPLATFYSAATGEQATVTLDLYERKQGLPDNVHPHPRDADGKPMQLIQIDYRGGQ